MDKITNRPSKPRRMARQPSASQPAAENGAIDKRPSKTELLLGLLRREDGATLDQMMEATGWLAHSTRAALTGLKKKDHMLSSEKIDGTRVYRIVEAVA